MNNMLKYVQEFFLRASGCIEILLFAGLGAVAVLLVANILLNPYAKHNKRAKRATKLMSRSLQLRKSVPIARLRLPDEYFDGFQNYKNSQSRFPSELMCFETKRQTVFGKLLFWIYFIICGTIVAVDGIKSGFSDYFVILFAGNALGFAIALWLISTSANLKLRRAKKLYKRFVRHLDISFGERYFSAEGAVLAEETCLDRDIDDTVAKIEFLKSSGINSATAREVANILSNEKLNKPRTHEQQRKLNMALNGLLQTLSATSQKQQSSGAQAQ